MAHLTGFCCQLVGYISMFFNEQTVCIISMSSLLVIQEMDHIDSTAPIYESSADVIIADFVPLWHFQALFYGDTSEKCAHTEMQPHYLRNLVFIL